MIANSLLDESYNKVIKVIQRELDEVECCSITTDGWSSIQKFGYISLTVHFVNKLFQLKSRTLTIDHIVGSHTGEVLQNNIKDLLRSWNLLGKSESISTDNGKQ